jgi:hypothetical protein
VGWEFITSVNIKRDSPAMFRAHIRSLLLLLAAAVSACGDSNEPSASLAGSYTASMLRITPPGESPADILASGGSLTLTIDAQRQVTGNLSVPPSIDGGINASMAGTAVVTDSSVRFDQTADTFVRDLTFAIAGPQLRADQTLSSGARYEVILARQ